MCTKTPNIGRLDGLTSADPVSKPTGAGTPADALGVTKRMSDLEIDVQELTECPTCGRSDFSKRQDMKIHHKMAHNEKLVDGRKAIRHRFEQQYERSTEDECWEWYGAVLKSGYGTMKVNGSTERAHRIGYWLRHGEIPDDLFVLHHCDNRRCVNPSHLYLGDHVDNRQDAVERDRTAQGEENGRVKLTEDDVREIKRRGEDELQRDLADEFGISQSSVNDIINGHTWSHVEIND